MHKSPTTMSYPYFLGPSEHCLPTYYRQLNRLFFVLSPLIFLANEFLVRPNLAVYKKNPDTLWSITALTLNAQIPVTHGMAVIAPIVLYSICLAINFSLLPKWGPRPTKIGMKSGLPSDEAYKNAYFSISNSLEKFSFICWNSILMPISFFLASFIPCMGINLFRGLS